MKVYERKKVTKQRLSLSSKKDEKEKLESKIKKPKKTRKSTNSLEDFISSQKEYFNQVDKIVNLNHT
jgi:hypothetical protein